MFNLIKKLFENPRKKVYFVRKGALTDDEIAKEKRQVAEEDERKKKEWIRLEIKKEECKSCYGRQEERNHYLNRASFNVIGGTISIICEFCGQKIHRCYGTYEGAPIPKFLEDVLAEEGFEREQN